jgi:cell division protein FtsW (lipid II flippase)
MRVQISDRLRLALSLLIPSAGGLCYLYAFDAPARLLAVNAGALALALAWIMLGRAPASRNLRLALAVAAALGLFVPLLLGPEVGGVTRWLPAGPVALHSGPLLLPLITVIAAREPRFGPALLALAGAALALQPDAAALFGLAAAGVVLAAIHRSLAFALVTASGAALAVLTFSAGTLEPQVFTEGVLAQVAAQSWLAAAVLAAVLLLVPLWVLPIRDETRPLAALLVALGAVASLAPFPYPLIGYGASSILGFGLALGLARHTSARDGHFLATP